MPKQGGQGKGKPKLQDRNFGKALIRQRLRDDSQGIKGPVHMTSILDNSALDDFVLSREMEGRNPEVKKFWEGATIVDANVPVEEVQSLSLDEYEFRHLTIPRKPSWTTSMTAEEVDSREKSAFVSWRREIAATEDKNLTQRVTPFEKNLEVWRQLWRVMERSDLAVQIVDARNPLLYYTDDLKAYASEQVPAKQVLLIVNKADFLTEFQRKMWSRRFKELGLRFVYYSAKLEQEKIDAEALAHSAEEKFKSSSLELESSAGEDEDEDEESPQPPVVTSSAPSKLSSEIDELEEVDFITRDIAASLRDSLLPTPANVSDSASAQTTYQSDVVWGDNATSVATTSELHDAEQADELILTRSSTILTRRQLIKLLENLPKEIGLLPQARHGVRICVGLLGYPNVGKSSVINSLLGVAKSTHDKVRVAVSSTPGKTKHFQTLILSESVMLCDCPGLVFPSFMNSTSEMICAGILPINQMRDYIGPAAIIASKVPQHLLEATYGMHITRNLDVKDNPDRPPNSHEMLNSYCVLKGYITNGTGRWDEFRACKELLRDFNDGRLLYVAIPTSPSLDIRTDVWLSETEKVMMRRERVADRISLQKLDMASKAEKDTEQIVFGDNQFNEETGNEESSVSQDVEGGRREHKRLKHWGKKNKKLRDKDPYGDSVLSYAAYSTNRSVVPQGSSSTKGDSAFTRTVHPHHSSGGV